MKRIRLFWKVLRTTHADAFLYGFFAYFGITAILIRIVEPNIRTIGESIWYCYVSCATIGFGDYTAVTALGRILTILLSVYAIFIIALIPGVLVSYFIESTRLRSQQSVVAFLDQLEHLDELSDQELKELSCKIRRFRCHEESRFHQTE